VSSLLCPWAISGLRPRAPGRCLQFRFAMRFGDSEGRHSECLPPAASGSH
jgi:hypothetical protein